MSWYEWSARPICFRLFVQLIRLAASRTFWTAGKSNPMRMAMMAITTNSSINVNACRLPLGRQLCTAAYNMGMSPLTRNSITSDQRFAFDTESPLLLREVLFELPGHLSLISDRTMLEEARSVYLPQPQQANKKESKFD